MATLQYGTSILGILPSGALVILPLGIVRWQISQDWQNLLISLAIPGQNNSDNTLWTVLLISKWPAMTDSCASFMTIVRYCCGTINCTNILPRSTLGELNFQYNKSFFLRNEALPLTSLESHIVLFFLRLGSSFCALHIWARVIPWPMISGVLRVSDWSNCLDCALVCTARVGSQFISSTRFITQEQSLRVDSLD